MTAWAPMLVTADPWGRWLVSIDDELLGSYERPIRRRWR